VIVPQFILASASPARRKLLQMAGIEPVVCPSDFDESLINSPDGCDLVQKLAQAKAETVTPKFPEALVLGCDSVLAVNGEIYGKPDSPEEAITRWQKMRGSTGILYTGHALFDTKHRTKIVRCGMTKVKFALISDRTIVDYVDSGEPLKCAGCFALEGKGGLFIEHIEGCHTNVIGLSLPLLRDMLSDLGYNVTDFWVR